MKRRLILSVVYLAFTLNMVIVPAVLALATDDIVAGEPVLLVVPPGTDAVRLVERTGGVLLGRSRVPSVVLTYSPDGNYFEILEKNGAWLLLNGSLPSLFCATG